MFVSSLIILQVCSKFHLRLYNRPICGIPGVEMYTDYCQEQKGRNTLLWGIRYVLFTKTCPKSYDIDPWHF